MSLSTRQRPYKALTHINLPFLNEGEGKRIKPGESVEIEDLVEAKQTDDDVAALIENGALGEEGDDIHPQNIIPDPGVPTIQIAIAMAQRTIEELKNQGAKDHEIPKELKAVAEMDYRHVTSADKGESSERNA